LDETLSSRNNDENWEKSRNYIVALISQCQDVMDQVLKYSAAHSKPDSENLSPFGIL
jgi:hypothetical protein